MMDPKQTAIDHLKTHVTYPATTEDVLAACGNWSDVDPVLVEEGKTKLAAHAGMTWNTAEELLAALGWGETEAAPAGGAM